MKKLIAICLVFCLCSGVFGVMPETVKAAAWYFTENFDSAVDGAVPKSIAVSPKNNIVETV